MESIVLIIFLTFLVIITYGLTIYYDKQDLKKCTTEYIIRKEPEKIEEIEQVKLYNIDNLSYLDFF
jgi:hypothetical protein|tara:strand:+ start:506 stop:703 length:198 start_codon:yes stop_codon:yes gene_type:complete